MLRDMIQGAFAAALTPLRDGGTALDEDAIEPYVGFLADGGVDGILALGTTGEGILLSSDERRRAAELFIRAAAGRLAVAVHCGAQTTAETAALAAHAAEAGADAVAVIGPPYFALDAPAMEEHFARRGRRLRAAPVLPLRVRGPHRLRGADRRDRAASGARPEPARAEGVRQAVGAGRALPARRARRLRRRRVARRARSRRRRRGSRLGARLGLPRARRGARARADAGARRRGRAPPDDARRLPVPGGGEGRRRAARGRRSAPTCGRRSAG